MINIKTDLDNWLKQTEKNWQNTPSFTVDNNKLKHLAIICDGNRRAAKQLNLNPHLGHRAGIEALKGIARACRKWGVDTLTFWVWSTENWSRDKEQVEFVMNLAQKYLAREDLLEELRKEEVKFTHLGRKDRLPGKLKDLLENLEQKTQEFTNHRLNLALDYGGVDEMERAIGKMISENAKPENIFEYLDTAGQPLPDLVIRPGMEGDELIHTSGFMPLQTAYSAWVFLPALFPNLTPENIIDAIKAFFNYQRRMGK